MLLVLLLFLKICLISASRLSLPAPSRQSSEEGKSNASQIWGTDLLHVLNVCFEPPIYIEVHHLGKFLDDFGHIFLAETQLTFEVAEHALYLNSRIQI